MGSPERRGRGPAQVENLCYGDPWSLDAEDVAHRVEAGWLADEKRRRGQGAAGVSVAVGGPHVHGERLPLHAKEDRVLARIVAGTDGVVANLVGGAGAGPTFAAVG